MILKAYRYRIYPTKKQQALFTRFFGCARFVWNFFLSMRTQEYRQHYVTVDEATCKKELTKLKAEPGYEWLRECDSTSLQAVTEFLQKAFERFWAGEAGYPKYKTRRDHHDSYTAKCNYGKTGNGSIRLDSRCILLPKVGLVRTKVSRPAEGRIKTATVSQTPSGKYYVSVICEVPEMEFSFSESRIICLDLGVKDYCGTNEKVHYPNPKPLETALKQLKREQRSLSRKTKGSHRYERQRVKTAGLHERIVNIRTDYQQKLSTAIIREASVIGTESLQVKELLMQDDTYLSRRISDCAWGEFLRQLKYKAQWYGRKLIQADPHFPSSQLCSVCGHQNPAVKDLSVRTWTCPVCGTVHDRDENAALNIEHEIIRILAMRQAPESA